MTSAGSAGWIICEAETRLHQRRRGVAPCPPLCLLLQHIVMCGLPPCRVHPRGGAQEISIHAHRADRLRRVALCPRHRAQLFLEHGLSRLFGWPSPLATPPVLTMYWFAGMIEMCGAVLFGLGLFTRPVAFIMSGEMAFAYFISHAPRGFFPILNGGDAAILYCFIFLYFAFAGAGPWSLDALWRKRTPLAGSR